jgi:hypothetical protein
MMKGIVKGLALAGLGLAFAANTAHAQKPGPEFGVQFAFLDLNNPDGSGNNSTNFGLGNGDVTVAFYINEMIAIEPGLTFNYSSPETGDASNSLGLDVAVPIYLKKGWGKAGGFFIAPLVGINRVDGGAGDAVTAKHWGVGVGTKMKINDGLYWRVQAFWVNQLEDTDNLIPKMSDIGISGGISLYWPN